MCDKPLGDFESVFGSISMFLNEQNIEKLKRNYIESL